MENNKDLPLCSTDIYKAMRESTFTPENIKRAEKELERIKDNGKEWGKMGAPKGNKYAEGCENSGRPSDYKKEHNELVYKLCLLGATDKQMADIIGISEETFNQWKKKYKEFSESLARGKDIADAEIAKSLYHRAKGYEHKETITATFQGKITDKMDVIKHYPPDTPAATLWLKNRQPDKWRDKVEMDQNITGGLTIKLEGDAEEWSK